MCRLCASSFSRCSTPFSCSRARAEAKKDRAGAPGAKNDVENERMAALYRQHVLKEQPGEPVVQIQGLGGSKKKAPVQEVVHNKEV